MSFEDVIAMLDDYKIFRDEGGKPVVLGSGGQAVTFLATHVPTDTKVALKQSRPYGSSRKELELMVREADVMKTLHHPQIPSYVDSFLDETQNTLQAEARFYLVTEFVDGQTLEDYVSHNGRLSSEECRSVAISVLAPLSYVHSSGNGLVHRDVNPKNIIIDSDGLCHLVDFGVTKINADETMNGTTTVGTLGYAAPEQLGGVCDARSDLYGLGATLFFCATGKFPAEYSPMGMAGLKKKEVKKALAQSNVADWLGRVILNLVDKPEKRYQKASHLFSALHASFGDEYGDSNLSCKKDLDMITSGFIQYVKSSWKRIWKANERYEQMYRRELKLLDKITDGRINNPSYASVRKDQIRREQLDLLWTKLETDEFPGKKDALRNLGQAGCLSKIRKLDDLSLHHFSLLHVETFIGENILDRAYESYLEDLHHVLVSHNTWIRQAIRVRRLKASKLKKLTEARKDSVLSQYRSNTLSKREDGEDVLLDFAANLPVDTL
ncbi:hypothetical protein COV93_00810 [Candidatus Woesearchaeota archaeon CG11_big_fil_rev_8_21_14_0_20_43_8]|nr:MAG: hypothetical protein COV93_00810 [Candidatus Woesearchaeota archaeon CG11_big_fil_rev_8_21_14_0_20_43_8]